MTTQGDGELDRIEGRAYAVQRSSAPEIEACLSRAIAIARTQDASLASSAHPHLACLWRESRAAQ